MKPKAPRELPMERRSMPRASSRAGEDWEHVALARVARHVAEIDSRRESSGLGWEAAALERIRSGLKR